MTTALKPLGAATLAALLLMQGASLAQAQEPLPSMQGAGDVQYACGGIGKDESTAMRAAMKDYPLSLLFAAKDGDYQADVAVAIKPSKGPDTIHFKASGPVCLLKLPDGHYTVDATAEGGKTTSRQVEVGKGSKSLDFRF